MTYDYNASATWNYDAEGRVTYFNSSGSPNNYFYYDGVGHRVEQSINGTVRVYAYDNNGHENTAGTSGFAGWTFSELYMAGMHVSTYVNSSTYFSHNDHLGSLRTQTDPTGNTNGTYFRNLPFGDWYDHGTEGWLGFTGDLLDDPGSLTFHTPFRQYNEKEGFWMGPDAAGLAARNMNNPQTWNRYAYALNNPLRYTDPLGLYCFYGGEGDTTENDAGPTDYDFAALNAGDCGAGGQWVDTSTSVTVNGDNPNDPGITIEDGQQIFPEIVSSQGSYADCVKKGGEDFSLASGLNYLTGGRTSSGLIGGLNQAFLGNEVSDVIAAFQGNPAGALWGKLADKATPIAVTTAASAVPDVTRTTTTASVTAIESPLASVYLSTTQTTTRVLPFGTLARAGAKSVTHALETFTYVVKLPIDLTTASFSAVVCGIGR